MSYIDNIFEKASIQQIRSFLLDETKNLSDDPHSYEERIDIPGKKLISCIRDKIGGEEAEEIINMVHLYGSANENVYMEIGMQIGALFAIELFKNMNKAFVSKDYEAWTNKKAFDSNKKE